MRHDITMKSYILLPALAGMLLLVSIGCEDDKNKNKSPAQPETQLCENPCRYCKAGCVNKRIAAWSSHNGSWDNYRKCHRSQHICPTGHVWWTRGAWGDDSYHPWDDKDFYPQPN